MGAANRAVHWTQNHSQDCLFTRTPSKCRLCSYLWIARGLCDLGHPAVTPGERRWHLKKSSAKPLRLPSATGAIVLCLRFVGRNTNTAKFAVASKMHCANWDCSVLWEDGKMARRGRGYLTVDVDLHEALESCDDDMILEEMKTRKLNLGRDDFEPMDDLREAHEELLRGRPAEALAILDRLVRPKWNSTKACEMELRRARARCAQIPDRRNTLNIRSMRTLAAGSFGRVLSAGRMRIMDSCALSPPDPRTINIRITIAEKKWLIEIAKAAGMSLSAFLRMAAIKEAHKILGPPKVVSTLSPAERP